jgi:His-Xaa-Ser system radical SAM maturase HxsC
MGGVIMQATDQVHIGRIKIVRDGSITFFADPIYKRAKTFSVINLNDISPGDIVSVNLDGEVHSLWRSQSKDNIIFATSVCNQKCQFCPQSKENDAFTNASINALLLSILRRNDINLVTITGGEPTLVGTELPHIIHTLLNKNPQAYVAVLSNGMNFDDEAYARAVVESGNSNTRICIAVHSDAPSIHDSITGIVGSFDRTAMGLLNLQRAGANIEIRIVLNRLNTERLSNIAFSIGMNFPFVAHVAFMGLELHANAAKNAKAVWVNPPEYMEKLAMAIYYLQCYKIPTSIYNLPYCLVPSSLWAFLRDSISGWKKTYLPICNTCYMKTTCPGLFGTSSFQSPNIVPIKSKRL